MCVYSVTTVRVATGQYGSVSERGVSTLRDLISPPASLLSAQCIRAYIHTRSPPTTTTTPTIAPSSELRTLPLPLQRTRSRLRPHPLRSSHHPPPHHRQRRQRYGTEASVRRRQWATSRRARCRHSAAAAAAGATTATTLIPLLSPPRDRRGACDARRLTNIQSVLLRRREARGTVANPVTVTAVPTAVVASLQEAQTTRHELYSSTSLA